MAPRYRLLLLASEQLPGGRVRYVFSVAPGWRVSVTSGAAQPSPSDVELIAHVLVSRWVTSWPRAPRN